MKRFLGIFYPPAQYRKINLTIAYEREQFFASFRVLKEEGYLAVMKPPKKDEAKDREDAQNQKTQTEGTSDSQDAPIQGNPELYEKLEKIKKGDRIRIDHFEIREGKTTPPKRYNSGSIILAMENAGQLIEDEELREQIKTCGIGTSATRAEILKKLEKNQYISLNKKTQILTPTLLGEMICDVVRCSISAMLSPAFTASWEKGLNYVVEGTVTSGEYMDKLSSYVAKFTNQVKSASNAGALVPMYRYAAQFYSNRGKSAGASRARTRKKK